MADFIPVARALAAPLDASRAASSKKLEIPRVTAPGSPARAAGFAGTGVPVDLKLCGTARVVFAILLKDFRVHKPTQAKSINHKETPPGFGTCIRTDIA